MKYTTIKIAVCDKIKDDGIAASQFISEFYMKNNNQAEIQQFDDTETIIDAFRLQNNFTAVFIGIYSMDDVDTAWVIRKLAPNCPIIIMSDSGDYSLEGYRLDAFGYWLKPLDGKKINETLERLNKNMSYGI